MPHLLVLQEGCEFGLPIWNFAAPRGETLRTYAPRELGDREGEDERSWIDVEKGRAWVRAYVKPWTAIELGRSTYREYAYYLPRSTVDFNWLCRAALTHGGCIEMTTPHELREEHAKAFAPIWSTARPLRYLCGADLCAALAVPWVYLLTIYNYAPDISVVVSESQDMIAEVVKLTDGVKDCALIPLEQALEVEQKNWEDIYRQFEEDVPLSPEQMRAQEEVRESWQEVLQHFGSVTSRKKNEGEQNGRVERWRGGVGYSGPRKLDHDFESNPW